MVAKAGHEHPDQIIDLGPAMARLENDFELLRDMAQYYLEDGPVLLEELERAIENRDYEMIARSAHSLKGLSSNFDAHAAVDVARCIEESGRSNDASVARRKFAELREKVYQVIDALQQDVLGKRS